MVQIISGDDACAVCGSFSNDLTPCESCESPVCDDCTEERWPDVFCSIECMN